MSLKLENTKLITQSDPLANILKKHNLYDILYQKLVDNDIDLEMLENDLAPSEIEAFCTEFELNVIQKLKFRKLMRIIGDKQNQSINDDNINIKQFPEYTEEEKKENLANLEHDDKMTIILIGDMAVGKSSLFQRFCEDKFSDVTASSTGVDVDQSMVELCAFNMKVSIWDTAGHFRFQAAMQPYYKKANCICIVYDISLENPFENTDKWLCAIKEYAYDDIIVMLVGNKVDLAEQNDQYSANRVKAEMMMKQERWKQYGAIHLECSAKTNKNVKLMVQTAVEAVIDLRYEQKGRKECRNIKTIGRFEEYKKMAKQKKQKKETVALESRLMQNDTDNYSDTSGCVCR